MKLVENEENVLDLPQFLIDEKLSTISVSQLADACNQTVETVTGILSGIRDEIVDFVLVKKNNASLNFGFGVLNLRAQGTAEFKSASCAVSDYHIEDKFPISAEFSDSISTTKKSLALS